jgi:hypothetical protein
MFNHCKKMVQGLVLILRPQWQQSDYLHSLGKIPGNKEEFITNKNQCTQYRGTGRGCTTLEDNALVSQHIGG